VLGEWLGLAGTRFAPVPAENEAAARPEVVAQPVETAAGVPVLDLTGVACPMNFVKTKIRLTTMSTGSLLDVILDHGEPITNVPLSLEEQGQKVLSKDRISDGQWRIRVEKTAGI